MRRVYYAHMDQTDVIVAGAGVIGLTVARALAHAGRETLILEAAHAFGTVTSSRNSEVIHAGIYYAAGSLKARLCVRGREQLYRYCESRGVPYQRCGKLIVATSESQLPGPPLPDGALAPAYSGIRPKLSRPGEVTADFRIDGPATHGIGSVVNLFGIESPGLTASLSIAEDVAAIVSAALR
jgi:L-2-hydroxyglutarate oxidase LhgO